MKYSFSKEGEDIQQTSAKNEMITDGNESSGTTEIETNGKGNKQEERKREKQKEEEIKNCETAAKEGKLEEMAEESTIPVEKESDISKKTNGEKSALLADLLSLDGPKKEEEELDLEEEVERLKRKYVERKLSEKELEQLSKTVFRIEKTKERLKQEKEEQRQQKEKEKRLKKDRENWIAMMKKPRSVKSQQSSSPTSTFFV